MKGLILAGGHGTRLMPTTFVISKHLAPVYDKPMIYYPLSTLMLAGIREFLVVSTPRDISHFRTLLGGGERWGIRFQYAEQSEPKGVADALLLAEGFLGNDGVALILGDNLFFGDGLPQKLRTACTRNGATVFAYRVSDPGRFGVVEFDESGKPCGIEEKPRRPASDWAVTGIYFYDASAVRLARTLKPSARGELEITDLNRLYLQQGALHVERLGRGMVWLDAGTPISLLEAGEFVRALETRQGLKISCPEEVALEMGYIDAEQLRTLASEMRGSGYGDYLFDVAQKRLFPSQGAD